MVLQICCSHRWPLSRLRLRHDNKQVALGVNLLILHLPASMSEDEMVKSIGEENTVDLIISAKVVHWFNLSNFYVVVTLAMEFLSMRGMFSISESTK